jgi:magnesium chelatase subunit D
MKGIIYPFAAIVGQEELKTALLLCAVNPSIGGILIRGDKGTAKSTAARGLADLLLPIERRIGCAYNCGPSEPLEICEICCSATSNHALAPVPFVNLPLGATEDRVLGSLDFEKALKGGQKAFLPGLLASAHRGILYIDEVNLLADHLVDVLLDVAAMGVNTVQREGLSVTHPAKLTLVGTMNLEEGDLRPQLLDRFALMVDVSAPTDPSERAKVVRRRIDFESSPANFAQKWSSEQEQLRHKIERARLLLPTVNLGDGQLTFISKLCAELNAVSMRADIVMYKAASTLAALSERSFVTVDDIQLAAHLVLPHRRRRKPADQAGLDQQRLDQLMSEAQQEYKIPDVESSQNPTGDNSSTSSEQDHPAVNSPPTGDQVFSAPPIHAVRTIQLKSDSQHQLAGRRSTTVDTHRGAYVRAIQNDNPTTIAIDATLRHAVVRNAGKLNVERTDLHEKLRVAKNGTLILFVVDASGSMAALKRMEAVKGCIVSLLKDAYERRDKVAVISFRGENADLLLSPTRSTELAERRLSNLPTGGRTPLPHSLALALKTLKQAKQKESFDPLLVLLTDGKANVSLSNGGDPWNETLQLAQQISEANIPAIVLDTESGYIRVGGTKELAHALRAEYMPLEGMSADRLVLTIRSTSRKSGKTRR